jgi:glutathione S-transferase
MKLHWSPRSPFVRKVMIAAQELGLSDRITCVRTRVAMTAPNEALLAANPLSKIPTLVLDDGSVLYDSRVICEYLDELSPVRKLIPADPRHRHAALRRQALGDGFLDLLLLWRNERDRPADLCSQIHLDAYRKKYAATMRVLDSEAPLLGAGDPDIGAIAIGCALSYLDFRFAELIWRVGHDRIAGWHNGFSRRPSVKATEPIDE